MNYYTTIYYLTRFPNNYNILYKIKYDLWLSKTNVLNYKKRAAHFCNKTNGTGERIFQNNILIL